jgi:hypothetical protein
MTDKTTREHNALLAQLSSAIADKTDAAIRSRVSLRDAVCAYVAVEQARGMPLAGVIETVKAILRKAEEGIAAATDELAQQLIDWCIEFHPINTLQPKSTGVIS